MRPSPITPNHVRDLNIAAIAAWKNDSNGLVSQTAYDLLVEELIIANLLTEMPTNPAYWSMQDVHAMQVYITRLQTRAEAYQLEMQSAPVPAPDDNLPL